MSQLDKALRRWEAASGIDRADTAVTPSTVGVTLNDYGPEGRAALQGPLEYTEPDGLSAPVQRISRATGEPKVEAELEARLVTGRVNPVSLEQYRRLAAVLHDAQANSGLKTVMLTSALPNEGKTLTTVNLALTLSDSYGRRVLLIDADLRWPAIHTLLNVPNTRGLTEALADGHLDLPLVNVSERLSVLTAGHPGPAPLAGLSSPRMGKLLEECGRRFDWVLLDTPPVGLLPDAQLLARLAGAVILVIGAGSTPVATVERAVAGIGQDCIIGTVLNRLEAHCIPEADYYDRHRSGVERA